MSWIDRLNNRVFSITTGDGKKFTPKWKNGEKSKEFNVTKYDFINVEGSFVERKEAQGGKYPLVFWYDGDDHIEKAEAFEKSANDKRRWIVEHPFYGTIKGQPTNLKRVDTSYGNTEISVDFWESIDEDYPRQDISVKDEVRSKAESVNALASALFIENATPSLSTSDIAPIKQNTSSMAAKFQPDDESYTDYQNTISKASKSLDNFLVNTSAAINDIQNVLVAPAEFNTSSKNKLKNYLRAFNELLNSIDNLASKFYFESQGASLISSMCVSALNPSDNDYIIRSDVENANDSILDSYNTYISNLDNAQVSIYDDDSFAPNSQIQQSLLDVVTFTSASLFVISFDARQERTIELEKDSNLIVLTHRFLGLDENDENIELFRQINNLKNNKNFKIRKGTQITYFV